MKNNDEFLGKIVFYSYRYTWVFFGSMFLSSFINYFAEGLSLGIFPLSFALAFVFSELIERTLGKYVKKSLIFINEKSQSPLDKRLYGFMDGWTAFLSALFFVLISNGVFKINPPFTPGPYVYLTAISGIIFFLTLFYCIFTKKI